jgi:DNA-binding IclR family transcriptional regulator
MAVDKHPAASVASMPGGGAASIEVLACLRKYGQRLDSEIAKEIQLPLAVVRQQLTDLAATGEVILCSLTRFERGARLDAWQCRVSGYVPPLAPGRKPKPST